MGIIGSIRKHSWVAVLIVGIAIIAFIIGDFAKGRKNPDFAKINNTTVSYQSFLDQTEQREAIYKLQYGISNFTSEQEESIREEVWQRIMMNTLTAPEFKKLGLAVTGEELSAMFCGAIEDPFVMQNLADPATGKINAAQIKNYTDNFNQLSDDQKLTWKNFENEAELNRLYSKYTSLISKGFYTPKAMAKQIADLGTNSDNVRLIALSLQSVSDDDAAIKEEDYKNYYEEHKEEFRQPEELRELHYVVFNVTPSQADLAAIQKDVDKVWAEFQTTPDDGIPFFVASESSRYDSTYIKASQLPAPLDSIVPKTGKGNFIAPMQVANNWVMAKVMDVASRPDSMRICPIYVLNDKAGQSTVTRSDEAAKLRADSVEAMLRSGKANLNEIVAKYSDVPLKAQDTAWVADGALGQLNDKVINTPAGGVFTYTDPRGMGYYVVKVMGKTTPTTKYRVAMINHEIVPSSTTSHNVYNEASKFASANRTYAELNDAAQKQNVPVRSAVSRIMDYNLANISNVREIVRWAYNEDTKIGDVANQIFEAEDMYIVVALKDVYKKGIPELAQLHDLPEFENAVRLEKKKEILMARAEEAQKSSKSLNDMAVKLSANIDTMNNISYNSYYLGQYGMEPKVIGAIAATKSQKMVGPIKGSNGVYMVQVDAVAKQAAPDVESVRAQLAQMSAQKGYLQSLIQTLKNKATLKDNRNFYF